MKKLIVNLASLFIAIGSMSAMAMPIFAYGFESYASGTVLDNVGGWKGWDNVAANAGIVSNTVAHSGANSIEISGTIDAVQPFSGITSGRWVLSAWQYIPSPLASNTYFIVNNEYNDGSPYTWAVQTLFDPITGAVTDDFRAENPVSIVFDQWVEIRNVIDLNDNRLQSYYNNQLLSTGTYTTSPADPLEIAALDLFTTGGTAYYDDISLTSIPEPATLAILGLGFAGLGFSRRKKV